MNTDRGPERPVDSLFNRLIIEAGKRNRPALDSAATAFDPENASGIVESANQASRFAERVLGVQRVKERLLNDLTALGFTPDDLDRSLLTVAKSSVEPKEIQPSTIAPEASMGVVLPVESPTLVSTPPIHVPEVPILSVRTEPEAPIQPAVASGLLSEPEAPTEPILPTMPTTPEKRYIQEDVGPRAAQVLIELYKVNETRDDFLHPDIRAAVAVVYEESLSKLPENKRLAKIRDLAAELVFNGFRGFSTKFRHAQERTLKIPKNLTAVMTTIAREPEYSALEVDEILQIPERGIAFQEIKQKANGVLVPSEDQSQAVGVVIKETPVSPVIKSPEDSGRDVLAEGVVGEASTTAPVAVATVEVDSGSETSTRNPNEISDIEAYILAKGLLEGRGSEIFQRLRLQMGGIDEKSIIPIVDAVNESLLPDDLDDRVVWEGLYGKLRAFISDPEIVLEANRGSDSHALLRLIRPLNTEEDLVTFLGSIPVKKKFPAAELTTVTTEEISGNNGQVVGVSVEDSIVEDLTEDAVIPTPDQFYISPIRFGHPEDRPTDEDRFRGWIEDQVYPRKGDPDVVLNNRSEAAWRLLMDFEDRIIHEDDDLLILDKPAGVNSHYSQFSPAGVLEIARNKRGSEIYLGHRLDRPTTGVMVLTKGLEVTNEVREQFAAKSYSGMEKVYLAILNGEPEQNTRFPIQVDIARTNSERMAIVHPGKTHPDADESTKRWSLTYFSPKIIFENGDGNPLTFAEIQIITGRTHQIRVVSADFLGQPIVGDRFYGDDRHPDIPRPLLHAFSLRFKHPTEGYFTHYKAPIPEDFQQFVGGLSLKYFNRD